MQIVFKGEPVSTQTIYKMTCRNGYPCWYMTKVGKDKKEEYQWQMKSQWKGNPTKKKLKVDIKLYFKDKRIHDIDNYNKILLDAGTGIIWEDDSQISKLTLAKFINKNPRIEVKVKEL